MRALSHTSMERFMLLLPPVSDAAYVLLADSGPSRLAIPCSPKSVDCRPRPNGTRSQPGIRSWEVRSLGQLPDPLPGHPKDVCNILSRKELRGVRIKGMLLEELSKLTCDARPRGPWDGVSQLLDQLRGRLDRGHGPVSIHVQPKGEAGAVLAAGADAAPLLLDRLVQLDEQLLRGRGQGGHVDGHSPLAHCWLPFRRCERSSFLLGGGQGRPALRSALTTSASRRRGLLGVAG